LNVHPLEVLSHELLHILISALQTGSKNDDLLIFRLQGTILEKYITQLRYARFGMRKIRKINFIEGK